MTAMSVHFLSTCDIMLHLSQLKVFFQDSTFRFKYLFYYFNIFEFCSYLNIHLFNNILILLLYNICQCILCISFLNEIPMNVCIHLGYVLISMKINRENMIDCLMCLSPWLHCNHVRIQGEGCGGWGVGWVQTPPPYKIEISFNYVIKLSKICLGPPGKLK